MTRDSIRLPGGLEKGAYLIHCMFYSKVISNHAFHRQPPTDIMSLPLLPFDLHPLACWIHPSGIWSSPCPDLSCLPHLLFLKFSQLFKVESQKPFLTPLPFFNSFPHQVQAPSCAEAPSLSLNHQSFSTLDQSTSYHQNSLVKTQMSLHPLLTLLHQHLATLIQLSHLYYGLQHSA